MEIFTSTIQKEFGFILSNKLKSNQVWLHVSLAVIKYSFKKIANYTLETIVKMLSLR